VARGSRSLKTVRPSPRVAVAAALAIVAGAAAAAASAPAPGPDPIAEAATLLVNERTPLEGVLAGGAPKTEEGFRALAEAGVRTFVDLRTDAELTPEVRDAAEAAGLAYERLPVGGEADLDLASARALDGLLHDVTRYPLALACSSGNRVGALLALEAYWLHRRPAGEALTLGVAAGMTRLEPSVRLLLGLPPAPAGGESASAP